MQNNVLQLTSTSYSISEEAPELVVYTICLQYQELLLRTFWWAKGPPTLGISGHVTPILQHLGGDDDRCLDGSGSDHRTAKNYVLSTPDNPTNCEPGNTNNGSRRERAGGMLSILKILGLGKMYDVFVREDGVHDLRNVLTLSVACHALFDALETWFEPTNIKHHSIHYFKPLLRSNARTLNQVVFGISNTITNSGHHLKLIDEMKEDSDHYLPNLKPPALHATCAKVAHMSGAARFFDYWDEDMEDKTVLAHDKSDGSLLHTLLTRYASPLMSTEGGQLNVVDALNESELLRENFQKE
ncbi:hypothetical protein Moror_12601 [Moniliophthora roreri MCA 2997]|uniref:HNH nuclease domain-containing protein n=1 Tax=Moniliophthora roreri (strain MCA 2997) TaxID=1381753 RepID=V2YVD3_MONRO|nr:hypothetical protein Moror_12601 [Moniliophthora roreri MCA 2997]